MKVCIESDLELNDLVWQIYQQSDPETIIELVKNLDQECQDWDVTKKLHAYFAKEMKKIERRKEIIFRRINEL